MARLKTVTRDDLTISRRRRGRGFCFVDANGKLVHDLATRQRAIDLAIPPAWTDVRIAADPLAHIQCCGIDDAGRVQYIYHPDWEVRRTRRKQRKLALLAKALPKIRRRVARDLAAEAGSKLLALAIAVSLIDRTAMRVGKERYLDSNGTRGAGTLYSRDIKVEGKTVLMTFPAKSGKIAEYTITDARLVAAIGRIHELPGKRLLVWRDEAGKLKPIKTGAINTYLQEISGADVSAKDFRTLHASALAGEALAQLEPGASESARKRQIATVVRDVSEFLRNTPTISRKSYIAPCLFKLFEDGQLAGLWQKGGTRPGLRQRESRLGSVLTTVA